MKVLQGVAQLGLGRLPGMGALVSAGLAQQGGCDHRIARFAQGLGGHRSGLGELGHRDLLSNTV
jgi:hypothetical protein